MTSIKSFAGSFRIVLLFALLSGGLCRADDAKPAVPRPASASCVFYVGTYTGAQSKGIYEFQLNLTTAALTPMGLAAETPNPTFLDIDAQGRFLYAANEVGKFDGRNSGSASAFSIEPGTGKLTFVNHVSSVGSGPCHILVDRSGKDALVANYGSGSAAVLPIQPDGSLREASAFVQHEGKGINRQRQERAHAHCVAIDPENRFAFVCDLGIDKIMVYKFDATNGTLTTNDPAFVTVKPGSGPRHLTFSKDGRFAYLISELSSTVTAFAYEAKHGALTELQTISTLPDDFKGENICAEIAIAPTGRFLYASNRGHDSITIFAIDPRKGMLHFVGRESTQGKTPRNFAFDPTGRFLISADQDSNKLVVFAVNPKIGRLIPTGQEAQVPAPTCVRFLPMR